MSLSAEEIVPLLASWIRGDHEVKVAVVQLPMGARSDTVVRAAVDAAGAEAVWLSMGGTAGVDIASAARSPMAVTFKKKVIVVDEYDAIVTSDQTMLAHISAAIKVNKVPVVLVGNSFKSKASNVPKGHTYFQVSHAPAPPSATDVIAVYSAAREDKGLAGAEAALGGELRDYRGDGIAIGGVYDNYLDYAPKDFASIADSFSSADVISEQMCRAGCFDDPYSFYPVSVTACVFQKQGVKSKPRVTTFGTVWSKTNAMYAKVGSARGAERALLEAGSRDAWKPSGGLAYIRCMIAAGLARGDTAAAAQVARAAGIPASSVLAIMRLWKSSKYTLATHAKMKKFLT